MTTEEAIVPAETVDNRRRQAALLRAIGLDKVPPEQREIAIAIANKYELDLLLKHLVLVEGRPYITRDGLLWIAHRSGVLDGIEVTEPAIVTLPGVGEFWRATCTVWRKDMTRPFTYAGRYPTKGGNTRFAPEMAVKVAESMALRRAFNVSAPTVDERWDLRQRAGRHRRGQRAAAAGAVPPRARPGAPHVRQGILGARRQGARGHLGDHTDRGGGARRAGGRAAHPR